MLPEMLPTDPEAVVPEASRCANQVVVAVVETQAQPVGQARPRMPR